MPILIKSTGCTLPFSGFSKCQDTDKSLKKIACDGLKNILKNETFKIPLLPGCFLDTFKFVSGCTFENIGCTFEIHRLHKVQPVQLKIGIGLHALRYAFTNFRSCRLVTVMLLNLVTTQCTEFQSYMYMYELNLVH